MQGNTFFYHLLLLYRPFEAQLNEILKKHHLYRAQWSVLYYLNEQSLMSLVELTQILSVEKPTMTRTVNRLVELGLVRQVESEDKREKRLALTELGQTTYKEVRMPIDAFEEEILHNISPEIQKQTIDVMKEICLNLLNR